MTTTPATPDLLEAIVAATRCAVAEREVTRPLRAVDAAAARRAPAGDGFVAALRRSDRPNVIAECKRRSPSRGVIRADYDPVAIARSYASAGAAAISVLTEPAFFDGAVAHLEAVRDAVRVPLLRKDFIVTDYQLVEARAAGADAVLLIVAALDDRALRRLMATARDLGLAVLTEVHDRTELARGLDAGAEVVGVNNRNLRTLEVDVAASRALIGAIPADTVAVAESGLDGPRDLVSLRTAGYDGFLIGESLMRHASPGAALADVLGAVGPGRPGRRRGAD